MAGETIFVHQMGGIVGPIVIGELYSLVVI